MLILNKICFHLLLITLFTLLNSCNSNEVTHSNAKEISPTIKAKKPISKANTFTDEELFGPALSQAVGFNQLAKVKKLLKAGVDVHATNPLNKTPIEQAIENNSVNMVRLLLKYNARPNYLKEPVSCNTILASASGGDDTRFFEMPLDDARKKGNTEIVKLLEQAGAKSAHSCSEAAEQERRTLESLQPSLK